MAILRRDDTVTNTVGNAIPGADVYYLTQPADIATLTPLAAVYSDSTGTAASNPQETDGTGHAVAYLNDGQLYTVVYVYPNGYQVVYPDQFVGSPSGAVTTFSGILSGAIDGTNTVFTLTNNGTHLTVSPTQALVWLNFPLIQGLGYTLSGVTVTFANPPQPASGSIPADSIYAQGIQ